jgi:hypothetical protein
VTISDLASFAPSASSFTVEPSGVGIVGMPANFVAPAQTHTATGEVLDVDVAVRFAPASFLFVYGDGASRETVTGGRSWADLGQAQFTSTETSHAYAARGTYTAHVVIRYAAAVDFGTGWRSVPGALEVTSAGTAVDVHEVRTALVEQTCVENPAGPGC